MTEEVFKVQSYSVGHKIDKQFLVSLEDIFKQYDSEVYMKVNTKCSNNTICKFNSISECFEYFDKSPYRIIRIEIIALFGDNYDRNEVELTFDNGILASTEAKFKFNKADDYLVMKNKIELCMKNFRLSYRILSVLPLVPTFLTVVFVFICIYTAIHEIVFSRNLQTLIFWGWLSGCVMCGILPFFRRIKRNVFPCTEFRIGQNETIEEKNAIKRNFLINTIIVGIVLGVIVNCISGFLF